MLVSLSELEGTEDEVTVTVSESDLMVYFPYRPDAIADVKKVEGAEYHSQDKAWSLPVTPENTLELYDLIRGLRERFQREADQALVRIGYQRQIVDTVLEQLQTDFEHPELGLDKSGGSILVRFPYNAKCLKAIRKVDGREWDASEKAWRVPADAEKPLRQALKQILKQL